MLFDYAKHQKLWYLLAVCIEEATKVSYTGNGCYSGYSELAKLKRRLLQDFFKEDDRGIRNLCFACNTAAVLMQMQFGETGYHQQSYEYVKSYCKDKSPEAVIKTVMGVLKDVEEVIVKILDAANEAASSTVEQAALF